MSLPAMERIAHRLEFRDQLARHNHDNPSAADDLAFLADFTAKQRPWKPWMAQLQRNGPTAIAGGLAGLIANPITLNQTPITGSATEQAIVPTSLLPVEQNVQSGKVYYLWAGGTSTTAATPGTYTLAIRVGPAPTNASPLFGQVSSAFTPLASMTVSPWFLQGFVVIRSSGTANTASCSLSWAQTSVASAAAPGPTSVSSAGNIGGISASFDSTGTTCALWIGVTHATSTTNTWIPQQVIWGSWN